MLTEALFIWVFYGYFPVVKAYLAQRNTMASNLHVENLDLEHFRTVRCLSQVLRYI